MSQITKNIIVGIIAVAVTGVGTYLVWQWDQRVLSTIHRGAFQYDSVAFRPTVAEIRIAKQFSDSILPELKRLGLITNYTRTEIETIITVSGKVWKKRSAFFKETFVDHIFIYNKVNGFVVNTKIIDDSTKQLYALISPPDKKEVY